MSAGTFSLMPGPPTVAIDAGSFAGTQAGGVVTGTTSVASPVIYRDVATRIKEAPLSVVQGAYMRSCRDFCKRTQWLRRNILSTALVNLQPVYNFGVDPVFEVLDVVAAQVQQMPPGTNWVNLRSTSQDTFDPNMAPDIPNWYSYLPEGMIVFYPTPNNVYPTKIELCVQTAINGTMVPNDLVTKFNLYLEAGARMHLYLMDKEPWFSPILAKQAEDEFMEGVGMGKSLKDKGNQSGSRRATPRPFIAR